MPRVMDQFPEFEALMRPVLQFLADGQLQLSEEIRTALARQFSVTVAMRAELLDSGTPRWNNLVAWALHHLSRARLIERPTSSRAAYQVTDRGKDLLARGVAVDVKACMAYPEWHLSKGERWLAEQRTRQDSGSESQLQGRHPGAAVQNGGGGPIDPSRWIKRCPHCGQANRVTAGTMRCGRCHETFVVRAAGRPTGFVHDSEPAPCEPQGMGRASPGPADRAEEPRSRPAASTTPRPAQRRSPEEDIRRREQTVRDAEQRHRELRQQLARRQAQLEGFERQLRDRESDLDRREQKFADQHSRDRYAREQARERDRSRFFFATEDELLAVAEQIAAERLRRFQLARYTCAEESAVARPGDDGNLPGASGHHRARSPEAGVEPDQSAAERTPPSLHTSSKRSTTRFRCAICRNAATFSDSVTSVRTSAEGRAADVDAEQPLCPTCREPLGTLLA
jgi:hypothetical protein